MKTSGDAVATSVAAPLTTARIAWRGLSRPQRLRFAGVVGFVGLVTVAFVQPLARLFSHANHNDLHSHIPLVPLIAAWLLYVRPRVGVPYCTSIVGAVVIGSFAFAALLAAIGMGAQLSETDQLALLTFAYLCSLAAGGFLFLGLRWMAAAAFPVAFLGFMIPLPDAAAHWLEIASVAASADVSAFMFRITGTPMLREGPLIALPGIVLEVARECSGIRSSWVLFITSVLASHLFLRSPWRRLALVAFAIPLGIVRNGLRILVIGLLSVHVGPHMVHSPIHSRGGPLFFALSLVPLLLFLWWIGRREQRPGAAG